MPAAPRPVPLLLLLALVARPAAAQSDTLPARRAVVPGLVVGGVAGAGLGVLAGLVANGVCEYECGGAAGDAVVGGLLGAAAGAGLGALVGAAIPRGPHGEPVGEASLRVGGGLATTGDADRDGGGPAVEAAFGPRFGRVVVLLEGGWQRIGSDRHLWRYGLATRVELGGGAWRPFVVAGLGGYSDVWRAPGEFDGAVSDNQVSWFGGSAGAGVRRAWAGSPMSVSAESRVHARFQDVGPPQGGAAAEWVSVLVAGHYSW